MINESWLASRERTTAFRIRHMRIGDVLSGDTDDDSWRIAYVSNDGSTPSYIVTRNGKEIITRKQPKSIINALRQYMEVLPDLEIHEGINLGFDVDMDSFEDAVPQFDIKTDGNTTFLRSVVSFWRIPPEFINAFRFILKRGETW